MEKISWTDRVKNEEVLREVKGERNITRTTTTKGGGGRLTRLVHNCIGNAF